MAHSISAKKAIRQNIARRLRNRATRSNLRTLSRQAREAVAGEDKEAATAAVRASMVALDKAGSKKTLHRNNAARKKSRIMKKLNVATASAS